MHHPSTRVVSAVHAGDPAALQAALASGASVDERDTNGHTALMLACRLGHVELAKALLEAGASPNRHTSDNEETVLHQLARNGGSAELIALVCSKAKLDRADRFGWTPLMVAAGKGRIDVVRALLDAGADATLPAPDGRTAAQLAQERGHGELVALLR